LSERVVNDWPIRRSPEPAVIINFVSKISCDEECCHIHHNRNIVHYFDADALAGGGDDSD
jgi:hypothetical protein